MSASETSRLSGGPESRPVGATTPGRTWTVAMPSRQKLLNANDRLNRYAKARIVKQLRTDAFKLAKHAKVPLLQRAQIDCFYQPPDSRRRDPANWADSAKACVDGFVDAGMLSDDSTAYLDGPFMRIGAKHPGGRLVFLITELHPNGDPS